MSKFKNSRGITLVALIITIIVLLILATVSINLVINNGILDKAKTAVDKYSEGEICEQIKLAYQEYQMHKFTTDEQQTETEFLHSRLDPMYGLENVNIIGTDVLNVIVKNNGIIYAFKLTSDGNISQLLYIQDKKTVTNTKTGEEYHVGDTVYYNSGVEDYEGINDNQGKWAILGAEDGKILIMSKESVGSVRISGKEGYLNGSTLMNNVCSQYKNNTYANYVRSVKLEDIYRVIDYKEPDPTTYSYIMVDGYVKRTDQSNPSTKTKFEHVDGRTLPLSNGNPINVEHDYYRYNMAGRLTSGSKEYNLLIGDYVIDTITINSATYSAQWGYRRMELGYTSVITTYESSGSIHGYTLDVRAVVALNSNVKLSGNSSTGWTPKLD